MTGFATQWAAAAAGGVFVCGVGALVVIAAATGAGAEPRSGGSLCVTAGPIAGLSRDSAQNAREVAATASGRAGSPAAVVAVMVGLTESDLRVLGNPSQVTGTLAVQGSGSDHDSLGIFQQRASWGSVQERLDPVVSTGLFLDRLLTLPAWNSQQPWLAAQKVQVSAFDGVPRPANHFSAIAGGNYRAQYARAKSIVAQIDAASAGQECSGTGGSNLGALAPGSAANHGLPPNYTIPTASIAGISAVRAALAELGRPYVWGAAGPNTFDCSGLTMWAWARAGVKLAHYTGDQFRSGTATTAADLLPGDLVLTPGADGTLADPQHVGMFIGHGLVVEAPQTGDVVKVVTYDSFVSGGLSGLRHIE